MLLYKMLRSSLKLKNFHRSGFLSEEASSFRNNTEQRLIKQELCQTSPKFQSIDESTE